MYFYIVKTNNIDLLKFKKYKFLLKKKYTFKLLLIKYNYKKLFKKITINMIKSQYILTNNIQLSFIILLKQFSTYNFKLILGGDNLIKALHNNLLIYTNMFYIL